VDERRGGHVEAHGQLEPVASDRLRQVAQALRVEGR